MAPGLAPGKYRVQIMQVTLDVTVTGGVRAGARRDLHGVEHHVQQNDRLITVSVSVVTDYLFHFIDRGKPWSEPPRSSHETLLHRDRELDHGFPAPSDGVISEPLAGK